MNKFSSELLSKTFTVGQPEGKTQITFSGYLYDLYVGGGGVGSGGRREEKERDRELESAYCWRHSQTCFPSPP